MSKLRVKRHNLIQPSDPSVRLIALTQNEIAIVDAHDYEFLMQWNWCCTSRGKTKYAMAGKKNGNFYMHRLLTGYSMTDHINGNGLDNRRTNLRQVTTQQNICNRPLQANNKSGYRGVSWIKGANRWLAAIKINQKTRYLGYFHSPIEAAKAYDARAIEAFGEFARPNFKEIK